MANLIFKWLKSENCSSKESKRLAELTRKAFGMTHREYRKMLSWGRAKENVLEKLMSENRWDEIEFDCIPSRAGLIYKNAFARRDMIAKKYEDFAKSENTKVNANALYPYEVVAKAAGNVWDIPNLSDIDRAMLEKYWNNLPDYFNGKQSNMLCVVDTSGSMTGSGASAPINVAISLGMYAAERAGGPFANHYISFSSRPQLIEVEGVDFVDKVRRIYRTNLCENTDLAATFDLLLEMADRPDVREEDIPENIVVISDMEIDSMSGGGWLSDRPAWTEKSAMTEMDKVRAKWAAHGHKMPRLIYWCVNSRNTNTILDNGPGVSFISGFSPIIFESVLTGKAGMDLCLEKLMSDRYKNIHA